MVELVLSLPLMVFVSLFLASLASSATTATPTPTVISQWGEFNHEYKGSDINNGTSRMFYFRLEDAKITPNTNLRLGFETDNSTTTSHPVLVNIEQSKILPSSFEVPFQFVKEKHCDCNCKIKNETFYSVNRTLCTIDYVEAHGTITIVISTQSVVNLSYRFTLTWTEDFFLELNQQRTVAVSPSAPIYFGYSFDRSGSNKTTIIIGNSTSDEPYCMTLSIQTLSCPMFDMLESVRYQGEWETICTAGAVTIERGAEYDNGFAIVLVAHPSHKYCSEKDPFSIPRNNLQYSSSRNSDQNSIQNYHDPSPKNIVILIRDSSISSTGLNFRLSILFPVISAVVVGLAMVSLIWWWNRTTFDAAEGVARDLSSATASNAVQEEAADINVGNDAENYGAILLENLNAKDDDNDDGDDGGWLTMNVFSTAHHTISSPSGAEFFKWIIIVSLFYLTPVCQFAIYYYRVFRNTGDLDMCYYNYRCAQSVGLLSDFNHLWSNLPYIIFGGFFIAIVEMRKYQFGYGTEDCIHMRRKVPFPKGILGGNPELYGVTPQYGKFQALGFALIMEGILSGAYHLCPNRSTFQFDTCFMQVIAVLLLMNLHNRRHSPLFSVEETFTILAIFVILSVGSLLIETLIFQKSISALMFWSFSVLQLVGALLILHNYCFVGLIRDEDGKAVVKRKEIICSIFHRESWRRLCQNGKSMSRLILPIICILLSVSMLVWKICVDNRKKHDSDSFSFDSYLLYILVGNVLCFLIYYKTMKVFHSSRWSGGGGGEYKEWGWSECKWWLVPICFFAIGAILGIWSMSYFTDAAAQWERSPSDSRAKNRDCITPLVGWLPPFYDSHDLWHFMSAFSLFFLFLGLLVLDDGLIRKRNAEIRIF